MDFINTLNEAEQLNILPHIFRSLSIEDRKNVRLTCELWNHECNRPEIIENEKFVFRMGNDEGGMEKVGNFLIACKTLRTSFEFQGLSIRKFPRQAWEHCGAKLRYLFLYDCDVDNETIKNVILYCTQLTHFHLQSSQESYELPPRRDEEFYRGVFCSERVLDELIEQKFEQKNLVSLKLFFASVLLPARMHQKLFQIYPCVRTFGRGFLSSLDAIKSLFNNYFEANRYASSSEEWPVLPPTIENFTSNIACLSEFWRTTKLKFKSFGTMLELGSDAELSNILTFFSYQTEIEKLRLCVCNEFGQSRRAKTLFSHILSNLPKLKELQFCGVVNHFSFSAAEFSTFLTNTSRLESLTMVFTGGLKLMADDDSYIASLRSLPSTKYSALRYLRLGNDVDERIPFEILSRCTMCLRYLYLDSVTDEMMQNIIKVQINLRTLRILNSKCTSVGLTGPVSTGLSIGHSFRRLRNLMHLKISPLTADILETFLSEFDFPNLRYFHFTIESTWEADDNSGRYFKPCQGDNVMRKVLETVATKAPRLEILKFNVSFLSAVEFINYCTRLKNLKFIINDGMILNKYYAESLSSSEPALIAQYFQESIEGVSKLFVECPSLHWVSNYRYHGGGFFYNRYGSSRPRLVQCRNVPALIHKHYIDDVF